MMTMDNKKGQIGTVAVAGVTAAIVIAVLLAVSSFLTFTIQNTVQTDVVNQTVSSPVASGGGLLYTVGNPPLQNTSETLYNDSARTVQFTAVNYTVSDPDNGVINITDGSSGSGDIYVDYVSTSLTPTQSSAFTNIRDTSNSSMQLLVIVIIAIAAAAIIGVITRFTLFK